MTLTADFVTNQPLTFQRMRALLLEQGGNIREGIIGTGDFAVSQHGAGNMSVDVATGAGWVQIDTGTRNGLSHVFNDAIASVAIGAAHATLPRIDQVVLQYNDSSIPAGVGGDVPTLRVLAGTATSGATLANRTGAASLPNDCLRLADVLVPAAAVSILTANLQDRRPWSLGQRLRAVAVTNGPTSTATTAAVIPEMTLAAEFTGRPVLVTFSASLSHATAAGWLSTYLYLDGTVQRSYPAQEPVANSLGLYSWSTVLTPAAGAHTIDARWATLAGTMTANALARELTVSEI